MNLGKGAGLELDTPLIPESLRPLVPLVQKWGFESQDDQDRFVLEMQAERPEEIIEFNRQIDNARDDIIAWGNSLKELDQHKSEIPQEAWTHPYWSFLSALKIRELTEPADSLDVQLARSRMSREARAFRFNEVAQQAEKCFRERDYRQCVELLESFSDLLSETQQKKLDFAKRHVKDSP